MFAFSFASVRSMELARAAVRRRFPPETGASSPYFPSVRAGQNFAQNEARRISSCPPALTAIFARAVKLKHGATNREPPCLCRAGRRWIEPQA